MPDRTPAKLAFKEHLKISKGNRGRPKHTWIRQINEDLKLMNKTRKDLTENNYERSEWKKTLIRLMSRIRLKKPIRRREDFVISE